MKYRSTLILFSAVTAICTLLRTIQIVFTLDQKTGFLKQQYSTIGIVLTVLAVASVVVCGAASMVMGVTPVKRKGQNYALAVFSVLTGGMFVFDSISNLTQIGNSWYDLALSVLGVITAFAFIAYGAACAFEIKIPSMVLVVPVFYFMVKMITVFITASALAIVTENVFFLITNGALLLFSFEFAKTENEIVELKKQKKLFGFAVSSAMLCVVWALPKLIALGFGFVKYAKRDVLSALLTVALGAFIICFILSGFGDKNELKRPRSSHLAE